MSFRLVQPGSQITRVYYSVPEHYGIGPEFDTWDDAVRHAQAKRAELVASLTESLGEFSTPEQTAHTADVQVRVDLRWDIKYPDGGGTDMVVESYTDVTKLRTYA
jgi:hypothetical protein